VRWQGRRSGLLIGAINDAPARDHFLARFLAGAGFIDTALGYQMRRITPMVPTRDVDDSGEEISGDLSESA